MSPPDVENLNRFLYRTGLAEPTQKIIWAALAGGVSSDIWRVDLPGRTICIKRALPRLRVEAEWLAPVERNNYEWEWFRFVDAAFDGIVPHPIAHDREMGMLAMEFLPPDEFTNWKTELFDGIADVEFAAKVGQTLGKIHAKSAGDDRLRELFATDKLFFALRIEPYLLSTARKHPDLMSRIQKIADETLAARIALVHGDVSPKNILKDRDNPVFLDAETAWYGDPAFDLAFCLNHFLLKAILLRDRMEDLLNCFESFVNGYLTCVNWEPANKLDKRAARLLPILFLARVDGKSPVEYLTSDVQKSTVRRIARVLIRDTTDLSNIRKVFEEEVRGG